MKITIKRESPGFIHIFYLLKMKNLGYESRYEKTPRKIVYDAVYGIDDSSSSSDEVSGF